MPILLFIILAVAVLALSASISGLLIYAGWNWGVLAAFPASNLGALTFWQSVALGLLITVIGAAFRKAKGGAK